MFTCTLAVWYRYYLILVHPPDTFLSNYLCLDISASCLVWIRVPIKVRFTPLSTILNLITWKRGSHSNMHGWSWGVGCLFCVASFHGALINTTNAHCPPDAITRWTTSVAKTCQEVWFWKVGKTKGTPAWHTVCSWRRITHVFSYFVMNHTCNEQKGAL